MNYPDLVSGGWKELYIYDINSKLSAINKEEITLPIVFTIRQIWQKLFLSSIWPK